MPIRNPFAKRSEVYGGIAPGEENVRPLAQYGTQPTFEKVDTMGSMSSARSIKSGHNQEPPEYKLSVVNDSGVYLPPSPPEKKGLWRQRSTLSRASNSTRNSEDIEHFSISRESFDSYRRSFDISARSPVQREGTRQSLDSARLPRLPRSSIGERRFERQPPTEEEGFEEVGLNDDQAKQIKKKGFFSRLTDGTEATSQASTGSRFHIGGRKRGQSGVGEELGNIPPAATAGITEIEDVH